MNNSAIIETIQEKKCTIFFLRVLYLELSYSWKSQEKQNSQMGKL